uniref:Xylulose kinase-1 n=1 Tax=Tanacetum cinerariifolium TaxID=118510 RepID=A0A6L2NDI1_TANCI|nr:hypothetical protein [Tanacetum cinerariifolium]
MVSYLTKSDASEGFNQIIDFLNESSIKYALTVNPNIYESCIKQFWTTVAVKKVNDVMRLQALVDKKKVVVTEATIRDALHLDDEKGVECLSNKEIFTELARMGYEKPSTKLTFYKAFFLSQWKFLIHTILKCMSAKRTSWNEFSSSMASAVICLSSGKGFSGVETPLFKGMLVAQEVEKGDADVNVEDVNTGDATEGDVCAANDEVPTIAEEPSIPSHTPPTPPSQPSYDIPSTSQVQPSPPQSPQVQPQSPQPQSQQDAGIPMNLLQEVMDTCTTLTRRVEHLELDKISQALEITKLKRRGRMIFDMDADADVVLEEAKDVAADAKADQDADVQDNVLSMQEEESKPTKLKEVVDIVTTTKIITEVVTVASTTITAADVPILATITAAAPTLTAAPSRRTKGVVIRDIEESTTTTSIIIHSEAKSKDKGKGIMVEEPKPLKKQAQIEQDEKYARELEAELNRTIDWDEVIDHVNKKAKEDPAMKRALKRINETPVEKATKRQNLDEEVEELKRHLQIVSNEHDDVYTEATPLAQKVLVVDYEIYNENNKPYFKIKRADVRLMISSQDDAVD